MTNLTVPKSYILSIARSIRLSPLYRIAINSSHILFFSLMMTSASASSSVIKDCDSLAAHPYDQHNPSDIYGVDFEDIDTVVAISSCTEAVKLSANKPRYKFQLGRAYHSSRNLSEAVKWYQAAADQHYAAAVTTLAGLYRDGTGVPQSYFQAITLYQEGADQNNPIALYELALMYHKGTVINQPIIDTIDLYRRASYLGYQKAEDMSQQLITAHFSSLNVDISLLLKAAKVGHAIAQSNLGMLYEFGFKVPQSDNEAIKWYQKSAEQGHVTAQLKLGKIYQYGHGVPQSDSKALYWFRKLAESRQWGKNETKSKIDQEYYDKYLKDYLDQLPVSTINSFTNTRGFYEARCSLSSQPNDYKFGAILVNYNDLVQPYYVYLGKDLAVTKPGELETIADVVDKLCKSHFES